MKKYKNTLIFIITAILSFIVIYAGQFFVDTKNPVVKTTEKNPVEYRRVSTTIDGKKQKISILEIDVSYGKAQVKPALSFNSTFGFETLSTIVKREKAYAGINAGFFYEYGEPLGLVICDGKMMSSSSGKYPAFKLKNGKASFGKVKTTIKIKFPNTTLNCRVNRDEISNKNSDEISDKTGDEISDGAVLYNSFFGSTNRVKTENITITVVKNKVVKIAKSNGTTKIPEDGFLITIKNAHGAHIGDLKIKKDDYVKTYGSYQMAANTEAYECGCYIVKNGKNVAPKRDAWIGTLENNDPRTAIGIKENGKVVLVTCDGRQPGYSYGMSGKEFAKYLIGMGVKDAAMLDGGATTEMIVNGKIVNKTSDGGAERLMGGAIVVVLKS